MTCSPNLSLVPPKSAFIGSTGSNNLRSQINSKVYAMHNLAGEIAKRDNVTTGEVTSYARLGGRTSFIEQPSASVVG